MKWNPSIIIFAFFLFDWSLKTLIYKQFRRNRFPCLYLDMSCDCLISSFLLADDYSIFRCCNQVLLIQLNENKKMNAIFTIVYIYIYVYMCVFISFIYMPMCVCAYFFIYITQYLDSSLIIFALNVLFSSE